MQRKIKFSKFRNIGLEKDEYLVLNGDFQKGKMGNLIVLIGPNNSGKSNVLDGIAKACKSEMLCNRDITNLSFEEKDRKPSVSLIYHDDKYNYELKRELNKVYDWEIASSDEAPNKPDVETIKKEIKQMHDISINNYGIRIPSLFNLYNRVMTNSINDDDLYIETMMTLSIMYENYRAGENRYLTVWDAMKSSGSKLVAYKEELINKRKKAEEYLLKQSGIQNITPKCIVYKENQISNSALSASDVANLQNSSFFKALFKMMKVDMKSVQNAYAQFSQTMNIQYLKKAQKAVQKKLDKISENFNNLYFASDDQYKFSIEFESGKIWFGMVRGKDDDPIDLEYQSTGFRWFFNLFFNFLASDTLNPGDIVIMDEPATNLHVQGQNELRAFIKQFAIENDILFIIATHSPFLIDVDHYDELRVVCTDNNRSKIQNRFTAINLDDPDSLLPIKKSLTIQQNVLYDLDTEVYFVEGITDYNYLTMFKKLLGIKNIAFLPFNGVGNNSAQTKKILAELIKVKFHKRSLLVDADKAGQDMYKQAQDADFGSVHSMSEVKLSDTKNAMMVEDLFSVEDKKKFSAIGNKNSDGTSVMKDHCKLDDFSKTTVDHFKELFRILQE